MRTRPSSTSEFEEVALSDAYAEFDKLEGHVQDHPAVENVRIYRGSVAASDIDWSPDSEVNLVIVVDGDLWCDGLLELFAEQDDDSVLTVYVRGNVSARDVMVNNDAQLTVTGDLEAERLVMCGGGNLGNITIQGSLRAGLVLEWTDGQIHSAAGEPAVWADKQNNIVIAGARWVELDATVAKAFLDDEGKPDRRRLRDAVRKGTSPFAT